MYSDLDPLGTNPGVVQLDGMLGLFLDFHGSCTNLSSHQQYKVFLFLLHSCKHLLLFVFFSFFFCLFVILEFELRALKPYLLSHTPIPFYVLVVF
jgi:hypothetical protein